MGNLMLYLYEIRNELEFERQETPLESAELAVTQSAIKLLCLKYCLYITNLVSKNSVRFGRNYARTSGLRAHLAFLNDDKFVTRHMRTRLAMWNANCELTLVEFILVNTVSFARYCDEVKDKWSKLSAVGVLIKCSKRKMVSSAGVAAIFDTYSAIAYLATDEQIEQSEEIYLFVKWLTVRLKRFSDAFLAGLVERESRHVFENERMVACEVAVLKEVCQTCFYLIILP
jgi:hypothetical protein